MERPDAFNSELHWIYARGSPTDSVAHLSLA